MILTFRSIDQWPEGWRDPNRARKPCPFKAPYRKTLQQLDRELAHLKARSVHLQVDATDRDLRLDGQLRADAKVNHPGVILTIDTAKLGVLVYPCDTFESRWSGDPPSWQVNLRAIALGLEALRQVERYGIADRGQQYAGFGALPPARAMGAAMTAEDAARFVVEHALVDDRPGFDIGDVLDDEGPGPYLKDAIRAAARQLHPDVGGDPELFRKLTAAREVLEGLL